MIWFRRFVFTGFFACIMPAAYAPAQSNTKISLSSISGQVAPPDSAPPAGSASQSGPISGKKNTRKPSEMSSARRMLASGSVPGEPQNLCFQPGLGWQRVAQTSDNAMQKTSPVGSSTAAETGASNTINTLPSGAGQTNSDQCPGIMTSAMAPGATVDNIIPDKQSQAKNSNIRTTSANFGMQDWLNADTMLNPASSSASRRLTMGLSSSLLSSSKHFTQGIEPSPSTGSVQELEGHSYVSPIKLRRMMRSAPDLETRLRVRKLSEEQKEKSSKPYDSRSSLKNGKNQPVPHKTNTDSDLSTHP